MKLLITVAIIVAALVILDRSNKSKYKRARESGVYPAPGNGTDADVERLIRSGRKMMAIKLYREIHDVGLKEAKEAVEKMTQQTGR